MPKQVRRTLRTPYNAEYVDDKGNPLDYTGSPPPHPPLPAAHIQPNSVPPPPKAASNSPYRGLARPLLGEALRASLPNEVWQMRLSFGSGSMGSFSARRSCW